MIVQGVVKPATGVFEKMNVKADAADGQPPQTDEDEAMYRSWVESPSSRVYPALIRPRH